MLNSKNNLEISYWKGLERTFPGFTKDQFSKVKVFFAIGNPGAKYHQTRHNAGFLMLDYLINNLDCKSHLSSDKFESWKLKSDAEIFFVKSKTFMNDSGKALKSALISLKCSKEQVLVLQDELEKNTGRASFGSGSPRGHNGIRSIFNETGASDFLRFKIGISKPAKESSVVVGDYVISDFSQDQLNEMQAVFFDFLNMIKKLYSLN